MIRGRSTDLLAGALAIPWLYFGVLHFTMHAETVRQMPPWFPWKSPIVYVTGVAELVFGLMLLPRLTRAWGALGTMALLVVYIPAVLNIVIYNAALQGAPAWQQAAFRWSIVPANVGLFFWARVYWRARPA